MKRSKARNIPGLETSRLRLRKLRREDAASIFAVHSDPKTVIYWSDEPLTELSQAEKLIEQNLQWIEQGNCLYWAIDEIDSGRTIGTCTVFDIHEKNRRAELGYIMHRDFWGKGLMSEALQAVIRHAFESLDLHRLEADTDPNNQASIALLKKFGFLREGVFRDRWFVHGKWHDSDMLGLLRRDFIEL